MAGLIPEGRLGIDTAALIYLIEQPHSARGHWLAHLVATREDGWVTSSVGLAELLVPAYAAGLSGSRARSAVEAVRGLEILPVTSDIAQEAARVRARTNFKLPDAIAIATAIVAGADAFLTNDCRLARDDAGISVLIVDDLANS